MKKFIIIGGIIFIILLVAIVGSILVIPNNEIERVEDILVIQKKLEKDYSCYGYTIDNPKIVVNPYKISPLSALIMFETKDSSKVSVYLVNKSGYKDKLYEEKSETKEHYLDIYGMIANNVNKVILEYKGVEYVYDIETKLDDKFSTDTVDIEENKISFIENNSNLIGVNSDKEIIYYIYGYCNIIQLNNGHLLVTSSRVNNDGSYVGFSEIDMLGRIYNDYVIKNGYYDVIYVMKNGNYLILSDDVVEIDKQNGKELKRFNIDKDMKLYQISYDEENKYVILKGKDSNLYYDYDKSKFLKEEESVNVNEIDKKIQIRNGNYYSKFIQNRFGNNKEIIVSNKNINLLFYDKIDNEYNKCKITFKKEYDRVVVNKECDKDVYVILDKFMGKKIYKINNNMFSINDTGLSGKYTIYVMIGNKIYKTGYFVNM